EIYATCQFAPRRGMARRLSKAGVRADSDNTIDPLRTRNRLQRSPDDGLDIDMWARGQYDRKLIAGDASARRVGGQHLSQPSCDGNNELITTQNTVLHGDVIHPVEFYEHESRAIVVGAFRQGYVQQLQRLGVVRQACKLVLVGRARRVRFSYRQLSSRAFELQERYGRQD